MLEAKTIAEIDRRKSERAEVDEVAFISVAGSSTRCRVVNISSDGAAIEVPDEHFIPARFRLMTERDRVIRNCRVAWMQRNRIGVEFVAEEAVTVMDQDRQLLAYRICC